MSNDGGCMMGGGVGVVEFLNLLFEVVVEFMVFDEGGVRFFELVVVEVDEDGFDVVDEFVNLCEVKKRVVDSLWKG